MHVDLLEHASDRLVLGRPCPNRHLLRVGAIRREARLRHRLLEHLRGSRRGDRFQVVHHRARGLVERRLLGELLDQLGDLFVVLRLRPGDQLRGLDALHESGVGNGAGQEETHVVRIRRAHAFQRVHDRLGLLGDLDVDLLQGALDEVVLFPAGQGDELIRLRARGELRLGHDHTEQRHGRRRVERLQRVDDHLLAGLRLLGRGGNPVDDLPNPLLLGRAGPDDKLSRIAAQTDPRLRNLCLQYGHRRRGGHPLDRVDLDRRNGLGAFRVDFFQDAGDRLVLARPRPDVQLLRVVRIGGDLGLRHGRGDYLHCVGRRRGLERVDGHLRGLLGWGLLG